MIRKIPIIFLLFAFNLWVVSESDSVTESGDILMSTSTGAYTFAMASNYNRVPKSGVVAVTSSGVVELVNRQSFQDTFINDL